VEHDASVIGSIAAAQQEELEKEIAELKVVSLEAEEEICCRSRIAEGERTTFIGCLWPNSEIRPRR
jgi:hypothetical protein